MGEINENLWAPWRKEYIRGLGDSAGPAECFLCLYARSPEDDAANRVVCRDDHTLVVMNRYPYTNGHLLIAPLEHVAELESLSESSLNAMMRFIREGIRLLKTVLNPEGFNVGMNLSRCAGAGLPGHLHAHVVPRWIGDTNFMCTIGAARVIPEPLDELGERLRQAAVDLGIG